MLGKQGRPYSQDIRDRIFVLFDGGSGVCRIAEQMMVTPSYVSKVLGRRLK